MNKLKTIFNKKIYTKKELDDIMLEEESEEDGTNRPETTPG